MSKLVRKQYFFDHAKFDLNITYYKAAKKESIALIMMKEMDIDDFKISRRLIRSCRFYF